MSKKILVTGVSGSGKSTLESVFRGKGYSTCDIDDGFAQWQFKESGRPLGHYPVNEEELSLVQWALRSEKLKSWIQKIDQSHILVFGSTNDLHNHAGLFDRIFLLEYGNKSAVIERLASRPDTGYGKVPHERDSVLSYFEEYQETMKLLGATAIDCTRPLDQIVYVVESEIKGE